MGQSIRGRTGPWSRGRSINYRPVGSFNQRDHSIGNMHDLYPTLLLVPVMARTKEYSISFPNLLDKKSFQWVNEDRVNIRNHDFNESAELVWLNFFHFEYWLHVMIFFWLFFFFFFFASRHRHSKYGVAT